MPESVDNDVFFAAAAQAGPRPPSVPEGVFYGGPRPAGEVSVVERLTAGPVRFAVAIFLIGWAGILFQASFLQQVVFGAPVFEELAKVGLPIAIVAALNVTDPRLGVPLAWVAGAGFGVFEHNFSYAHEDLLGYTNRVVFHAGSTGLSMALWAALASAPDRRAWLATTSLATLLHWGNNFGAVAFGFASLLLPVLGDVALGWSMAMGGLTLVLTFPALVRPQRSQELILRALATVAPRLAPAPAEPAT